MKKQPISLLLISSSSFFQQQLKLMQSINCCDAFLFLSTVYFSNLKINLMSLVKKTTGFALVIMIQILINCEFATAQQHQQTKPTAHPPAANRPAVVSHAPANNQATSVGRTPVFNRPASANRTQATNRPQANINIRPSSNNATVARPGRVDHAESARSGYVDRRGEHHEGPVHPQYGYHPEFRPTYHYAPYSRAPHFYGGRRYYA